MLAAEDIKAIALGLGADKCGISSAERFDDAPKGFQPRDVYSRCKSAVVFLKQMPPEVIDAENPVVYTHTAHLLYDALDKIGLNLCISLEKRGIHAVPVPTDVPYLHWDAENKHGMGIISMRHAAYNAGLGILGSNTLLINRELGNLVYIGAILIDAAVELNPIVTDFACPPGCRLCLDACPVQALDGITVIQKLCREHSTFEHARGWDIYTCSKCRRVCPLKTGV
jgi:epoxyqueuosine reductase QueG